MIVPRPFLLALAVSLASAIPALAQTAAPAGALPAIDAAIADGRIEAARDMIGRLRAGGDTPQLQLRDAELALAGGQSDAAIAAFTTLARVPAVAALAQQGLGIAELRAGNVDTAVVALDAAIAADPALLRALLARGVAADRQRDWPRAEACYASALALDPRSAAGLTNRGYSRLLRGQYSEAETDLAAAVAVDPRLAAARTNLRLARAMQGDYKGTATGASKADVAADLNTIGFAAMTRGDYAAAEGFFNRAMQTNPAFDHVAWDNLIYLKALTGKPVETLAGGH